MPQFDPSSYTSQIFWLLICFGFLYFFLSAIILPRVKSIIDNRNQAVDKDNLSAEKLKSEISALEEKSRKITSEAESNYRQSIDKAIAKSILLKDDAFELFKKESKNSLLKCHEEIDDLVKKSQSDSDKLVNELTTLIENKITG